jgi:5'(3')-deoxyribonucleotidase
MKNNLHILLDMDGVLADFFSNALRVLNRETGRDLTHADCNGGYQLEKVFGISKSAFWRAIESDPNFWDELEPFEWAGELLEYLRGHGDVTISTSPSRDPNCHYQKIKWLRDRLGICADDVMLGGKKWLMARSNHLLVDDFPKNVDAFREHGGQALLVPSGWNAGAPGRDEVFACLLGYFNNSPIRVQRKRVKGWKMPPNTVSVCRPNKWGNPYRVGDDVPGLKGVPMDAEDAVHWFEILHAPTLPVHELRGKNLACFCALDQPCHADVLLRLANK